MRRAAAALVGLLVLATLGRGIASKERLLRDGETILVPLRPRDPRSLMQGDYMDLRYDVPDRIERAVKQRGERRGRLVVRLDGESRVSFLRPFEEGEELGSRERLLRYVWRDDEVDVGPRSFFFEEGRAELFANARFGELRLGPEGSTLLVGLRDERLKRLGEGDSTRAATGVQDPWMERRQALVDELERDGIRDEAVLRAMRAVERHLFVPSSVRGASCENHPLPIGSGQTISQPYIVAYMSELAALKPTANVLEVGTGSGYQAAVLAEILGLRADAPPAAPRGRLCSIEILPELARSAAAALAEAGYEGVELRVGDGYRGWPERAPFDAILVTAAPGEVPEPLVEQLAPGGRLVIPVGEELQHVELVVREEDGSINRRRDIPVRFVPMTGEAEKH